MRSKKTFSVSAIVSILIHATILILLVILNDKDNKKPQPPIKIAVLSQEEVSRIPQVPLQDLGIQPEPVPTPQHAIPVPPPQESDGEEQPTPPSLRLGDQIVEVPKPEEKEKPPEDTTRLKADQDSSTDKPTVARGSLEEIVSEPAPGTPETPESGGQSDPSDSGKGAADGTDQPPEDGTDAPKGDDSGDDEKPPAFPNLVPTPDQIADSVNGGGGSVDDLPDVGEGDITDLNTIATEHAPFYNRVKRLIAEKWHPAEVHQRNDPTGKVWGQKDRLTVVQITLSESGEVLSIIIDSPSGAEPLDVEAQQSVIRVGKFVNVPKALIKNGKLTFRFGFRLRIGNR